MPSTYTSNLGLEKPATGERAGTWGTMVNDTFDFLDMGIDGSVSIGLSGSSYVLQTSDGVFSAARNKVLVFTGPLSGPCTITIGPNDAQKIYYVLNQTTGGFQLVFLQGTGSQFTLFPGRCAVIYTTGTGAVSHVLGALADLQTNSLLVQTNLIINGQITWNGSATISQPANFTAGVTIAAPCTVNLGGDVAGDLLYRSAGGPLARLPIGASGQVLSAAAGGVLTWVTPAGVNIGTSVGGASANRVFFADGTAHLAQDAGFTYAPGGLLTLRSSNPSLTVDTVTPNPRYLTFTTNSVLRWYLGADSDVESGTTIGSNFRIRAWNNLATVVLDALTCFRNGHVVFGLAGDNFSAQVTVQNAVAAQDALTVVGFTGQTGKLQTWRAAGGAAVASMDVAGNLVVNGNLSVATINGSVPGGGGGLSLDANKRLEIGVPAATGHPLGTLHIGLDTSGANNCTIAMERSTAIGSPLPVDVGRLYFFRSAGVFYFVLEYSSGGNRWCTYIPLTATAGSAPAWQVNTVPVVL